MDDKLTPDLAPKFTNIIQSKQLTLSRYKLNATERRILTHEIHICQKFLAGKKLHGDLYQDPKIRADKSIWGDLFVEMPLSALGATDDNRSEVKNALKNLRNKTIEIVDGEDWALVGLIEMPRIVRGVARFAINEQLVKAFLNFSEGYNQYYLETSLSLSSVYAMRFYEIISNNEGISELIFSVDYLRELFDTKEEKYTNTADFVKRVILRSKQELDEKSPWSFDFLSLTADYKVAGRGKKIEFIKFIPTHHPEKDDPRLANKNMHAVNDKALLFLNTELRNWLLNNGWARKEIENNRELWLEFTKAFPQGYEDFARMKWQRAQELAAAAEEMGNPDFSAKGWFINAIKGRLQDLKDGKI